MNMRPCIERILEFAAGTKWDEIPVDTCAHVKALILDSLTVLAAGHGAVGCREVLDLLSEWRPQRGASVLLGGLTLAPHEAAMANAMLAEAWDFDDTHDEAIVHCVSPVLYSALAIAECSNQALDGSQFLAAVAVGLEVLARLGMACTSPLSWTRTATLGGLGGAIAAARVSRAVPATMIDAVGIAYMQAAGNSQTILDAATAKKLQVGFASRAAVLGTLLASRGLTGPHDILEGKYGYYELYERGKHNLGQAFADLGNSWEIDNISVKPFSCARETHAAIFAALEASASRKFALADIDHVVVTGPGILQDISGKPPATAGPASVVSAHLSIPYVVAVILLEGDLTLLDFTQARVLRPERQALANSIRVEAATTLPHNDLAPVDLAITTREGGVIRGRCTELPSGIASGLDESAMERKRRSCVNISPWPEAASCLARVGDLLRVAESTSDLPRALIECMSPL